VQDGAIGNSKLGDDSVTSGKIADGEVGSSDLADDSVTTAKVADGAISTDQLASSSVTTDKVADLAITLDKLADNSVNSDKIVDGTVAEDDLATASVGADKIQTDAVTTDEIEDGTIESADLDPGLYDEATNVQDRTVVTSDPVTITDASQDSATVTCPTDTVAVGGGGASTSNADVAIVGSYPDSANAQNWTVDYDNNSGGDVDVTAYAVCVAG
ncbi:MAG: hypothetical protein ACOC9Y_09740, partial [Chloroflexota bacterium]